ncbi:uncharacterized protein LOC129592747 [Paramacrobiotus metropolitanus]|uniref:uncharacterized protein LOC129592747 n=1 Tax=Paramacrobiotus metropolitanus TaxID=2943436 RepID=UPI002446327A|nr:uncharacterized protein LOC129592747 [Paramacrobiotus metropolitanus]
MGGFGSVYKATLTQPSDFDGGEVAVKLAKISMEIGIINAAEKLKKRRGDLEILLGRKKKDRMEGTTPFSKKEALCYAVQIIEGVSFLHRNNITHGDLKHPNILVKYTKEWHPHLLIGDLDDLIQIENSIASRSITNICGSIRYMSPEMLRHFGNGSQQFWEEVRYLEPRLHPS